MENQEVDSYVKLHWYCLVFNWITDDGAGKYQHNQSGYTGNHENKVRIKDIKSVKRFNNVPIHAVMMSCSYLGHMTKIEFNEE